MSAELFRRAWKVVVDTLDVSALDIEFKILSSIKPQPNKCVLTVWNLNQDHRAALIKRNRPTTDKKTIVGIPVQVEAGYVDNTSVLFSGDVREVASQRDGLDWKTTLSGEDGGRAYREGKISATFAKGTPISTVLQQCCTALGVGLGNAANFEAGAEITGLGTAIPHALTFHGAAAQAITDLTRSIGLTWSIQRGHLQLMKKAKPLDLGAILLTPTTGLLGSPEASIDSSVSLGNPQQFAANAKQKVAKPPKPKDSAIVKLKTLLIPGLIPGRKIELESASFHGGYMVTEVECVGQSWATDWNCNLVARAY